MDFTNPFYSDHVQAPCTACGAKSGEPCKDRRFSPRRRRLDWLHAERSAAFMSVVYKLRETGMPWNEAYDRTTRAFMDIAP